MKYPGSLARMEETRPPTLDLTPISQDEIDHSPLLLEAQRLSDRLAPYANNNTMFDPRLLPHETDDRTLAIFGRVLGGLFFVDLKDGSVGLLPISSEAAPQYCNSHLRSFAAFHSAFMAAIRPVLESSGDPAESTLTDLEAAFRTSDPASMADEGSVWPTRLYELSEGFFPLSSERVELHRLLGIDLDYPW